MRNPFACYFEFENPEELVQSFAAYAARTVCARRATQDILVGHRRELEQACLEMLQSDLDRIGSGLEVLQVSFCDVHAPVEVHYFFRDLASAAEEKHMQVLLGEGSYVQTLAEARAKAFRIEKEAESASHATRNRAEGEAIAFEARASAFAESAALTRLRMLLETLEEILPRASTIWPLAQGIHVDLWLQNAAEVSPPFLEESSENPKPGGKRTAPAPDSEENDKKRSETPDWLKNFPRR
jgi:membrane protease subunit HflK